MNNLELVQMLARESGTVSGSAPVSLDGLSGRLEKMRTWVRSAWVNIQELESDWRWMRRDFASELSPNAGAYTGSSFSIQRLGIWKRGNDSLTLWDPDIGIADEGPIRYIPWDEFKRQYRRGETISTRPVAYSIAPDNRVNFGPIPDKSYGVKGEYILSPQQLEGNSMIPEFPSRYHELIVWYALVHLAGHDEAPMQVQHATMREAQLMDALYRNELAVDRIHWPEALA